MDNPLFRVMVVFSRYSDGAGATSAVAEFVDRVAAERFCHSFEERAGGDVHFGPWFVQRLYN